MSKGKAWLWCADCRVLTGVGCHPSVPMMTCTKCQMPYGFVKLYGQTTDNKPPSLANMKFVPGKALYKLRQKRRRKAKAVGNGKRNHAEKPVESRCHSVCRDCGCKQNVPRWHFYRAARPRCSMCGGSLDYQGTLNLGRCQYPPKEQRVFRKCCDSFPGSSSHLPACVDHKRVHVEPKPPKHIRNKCQHCPNMAKRGRMFCKHCAALTGGNHVRSRPAGPVISFVSSGSGTVMVR